jgi:integrase
MSRKPRRRRFGSIIERARSSGGTSWHARWRESTHSAYEERAFSSEELAKKFLDQVEARLRLGTYEHPRTVREAQSEAEPVVTMSPLFNEYAQRLLDTQIKPTRAQGTGALYQYNLDRLKEYFGPREVDGRKIPAKRLDEISRNDFLAYRVWRRTLPRVVAGDPARTVGPVGPACVNREQQLASVIFNHAVADERLLKNPLSGLKTLKEPRNPRRWLTKTEVATIVAAADEFFRPFVVAAIYTGARPCELRNLTWGDVGFESKKISVTRTKVGNADSLDLHPAVEAELRKLREKHPDATAADPVFLNRRGEHWQDFRYAWRMTLKAAKIEIRPGLSLYSLRHTHATHFLEHGGAVTDLRAQLGHADLATTQRYADLVSERRKATVMALDFSSARETAVAKEDETRGQPDSVKESVPIYEVHRVAVALAVAS